MAPVPVYKWELFDPIAREFVPQRTWATAAEILAKRGVVMHATESSLQASPTTDVQRGKTQEDVPA